MQIKTYFRILLKYWWILLFATTVVVVGTIIWMTGQQRVYQSKSTYILRPRAAMDQMGDDFVRALEMVSRRVEINTTFAEVAASKLIKTRALEETEYSSKIKEYLDVSAVVLGGTNILEITVEGPTAEIAQEFCYLVGMETHEYVGSLYDVFELQLLDGASYQEDPVRPNLIFNLIIGLMLGIGLGAGLAFLVDFIVSPPSEPNTFNIIDRETGAYNRVYLEHRLRQELNRAKRHDYPISLGLIKFRMEGEGITETHKNEIMRLYKIIIENEMREEDLLGVINKNIFAFVYPFLSRNKSRLIVNNAEKKFASMVKNVSSLKGRLYFKSISTVIGYTASDKSGTDFLDRGLRELQKNQS